MAREGLLSVLDIAQELNSGKATTKFMLKRFKKWLPYDLVDGQAVYPPEETIKRLFIIQENLDMGMLPSNIEKKLDMICESDSDERLNRFSGPFNNEGIQQMSEDGLILLKSLFHDIIEQQKRIAVAQEKRAFTEEKKVAAMNNIAQALQEMNKVRTDDSADRQMAHQADAVIAEDEAIEDEAMKEDMPIELDDLSALIDEDDNGSKTEVSMELDDLSTLIDRKDDAPETDASIELDDLSKLIDVSSDADLPDQAFDDLSQLIEDNPVPDDEENVLPQIDDLSKLVDDTTADEEPALPDDKPEDTPTIKIDISPEEDLGKYKAAVTKIIIGLKADGLSVEEAAARLNQNKIKTLSGKSEWSRKAISQIYKFIESAK